MPVIMGALGIIKKGTDKHYKNITKRSSLYEILKKKYTLRNCSSLKSYQYDWKILPHKDRKIINPPKMYIITTFLHSSSWVKNPVKDLKKAKVRLKIRK